jgi:paraquat-inducible protein B
MEPFKEWMALAALTISVGTVVFGWFTAGGKKALAKLEEHRVDFEQLKEKVATIESEIRHLPSKEDVHQLNLSMAELKGTAGRQEEKLAGVERTVRRVEEFLLEHGGNTRGNRS